MSLVILMRDQRLLAEGFLGVYESGYSDKTGHVEQLCDGPSIAEFKLTDTRLTMYSENLGLLSYLAVFRRSGNVASSYESMYVSSLWQRFDGQWLNVFSQDTPVANVETAPIS